MRRAILLLIYCAAIICPIFATNINSLKANSALQQLDQMLMHRDDFIAERQLHIDSLRHLLVSANPEPTPDIYREIGKAYKGFNNDSALYYLWHGALLCQGAQRQSFEYEVAAILPLAGFFDDAIKLYSEIEPDSIAPSELIDYYDAGRQMYSYLATFFKLYPEISDAYSAKSFDLQSKLIDLLPENGLERLFNVAEQHFILKEYGHAQILLEEIMDKDSLSNSMRARAAHHLAAIAKANNDKEACKYYLALSAIADVQSATREVASLQDLGTIIYEDGDIKRSHNLLTQAMANAVECGAPLRMIETSKALPLIERANIKRDKEWKKTIYWIMSAMALLLLILVITLLFLRHEMHKMSVLQCQLIAANNAKEVYISRFLELCSIYMDKLNQFCKIVTRKLTAGQTDELLRMAKSGKFVEEQSREFYDVFDDAFLHIYPNFIEDVNALLRPDSQITMADGEKLNTDLRILAFMRLGIEESSRIAQVLNYSLNTIYSYRNRLKARAINRETFEKDILNIN